MTEPTDAEIRGLAATGSGVYQDDETAIWEITDPSLMKLVHAALEKWGQPAQTAEPVSQPQKNAIRQAFDEGAEYSANEWHGRVKTAQLELEAYRKAYQTLLEQVAKGVSIMRPPPLVISAPQPVARKPISNFHAADEFTAEPHTDDVFAAYQQGIRFAERHHGIKGGQHG